MEDIDLDGPIAGLNPGKAKYILENGADAVGESGPYKVTEDELQSLMEEGEDIFALLDQVSEDYTERFQEHVNQYVDEMEDEFYSPEDVRQMANDMIENIEDSRKPRVNAAGAVYAASLLTNSVISQKAVSNATGVSEYSIRKSYIEICEDRIGEIDS